jgi:LPXTG-motif cell wall-anchored protein
VPIKVDRRKGAIDGTLFWVGSPTASKTPFVLAGIVIVIAGTGFVLATRRRRRDEEGGAGERDDAPGKEAW